MILKLDLFFFLSFFSFSLTFQINCPLNPNRLSAGIVWGPDPSPQSGPVGAKPPSSQEKRGSCCHGPTREIAEMPVGEEISQSYCGSDERRLSDKRLVSLSSSRVY